MKGHYAIGDRVKVQPEGAEGKFLGTDGSGLAIVSVRGSGTVTLPFARLKAPETIHHEGRERIVIAQENIGQLEDILDIAECTEEVAAVVEEIAEVLSPPPPETGTAGGTTDIQEHFNDIANGRDGPPSEVEVPEAYAPEIPGKVTKKWVSERTAEELRALLILAEDSDILGKGKVKEGRIEKIQKELSTR